jgi:hypothetical protein
MAFPVRNEETEVKSRLNELFGLSASDIQDVVMQGVLQRTFCTLHHPRTYPGLAQWAETVRALRDKTVSMGWGTSDDNNFPLSIHPSGNLVIAVQTGDNDTGFKASNPSNRAVKGTNTEQAVWANQKQFSLFDSFDENYLVQNNQKVMWVLLYHVFQNEVRYELSLPSNIIGGKIRSWQERLILPAITLEQNYNDIEVEEQNGQEFDINVERKQ